MQSFLNFVTWKLFCDSRTQERLCIQGNEDWFVKTTLKKKELKEHLCPWGTIFNIL